MAAPYRPTTENQLRESDHDREAIYLAQKQRLRYLLTRYAPPHLSGVELFRRLRLADAFSISRDASGSDPKTQEGLRKKIVGDRKRWLPDTIALSGINEGQFKQWMQL